MSREARIRRNDSDVIDGQHRIKTLIDCLDQEEVKWTVDAPDDPNGEWWVDITFDGYSTNVAWRHDRGFGLYITDDEAFGARPDEIYREPELAAKRLMQLARRGKGDERAMRLAEVRNLVDKPQVAVAERLCKDQGFVSRLEHQNDAKLSTIRAYVEALGGEVRLLVCFDGFEAPVDLPVAVSNRAAQGHSGLGQSSFARRIWMRGTRS